MHLAYAAAFFPSFRIIFPISRACDGVERLYMMASDGL
jgi:hypothetical protein